MRHARLSQSSLTFASKIDFEYDSGSSLKDDFGPFYHVQEALLSDLNTPEALGRLFRLVRELTEAWNRGEFEGESEKIKSLQNGFQACLDALGLVVKRISKETLKVPSDIHEIAEKRWQA